MSCQRAINSSITSPATVSSEFRYGRIAPPPTKGSKNRLDAGKRQAMAGATLFLLPGHLTTGLYSGTRYLGH